ncbi:MAG: cadherin [Thiolinea sp.]
MNKNKSLRLLTSVMGGAVLSLAASTSVFAAQVLEYKLSMSEDGETYEVWMRASETPTPDINLTGQLTLKAPTEAEFKVTDVVSAIEGADWIEASRVNAPDEATDSDYISFSFIGLQGNSAHNYHWEKDTDKLIFTFKNKGGCVDGVSVIENDDPFNIENNSANTNPGNQFTNLGWGAVGENNFKGVYGGAVSCPK